MRLNWGHRQIDGVVFQSSITDAERARLETLASGKKVLEIGSAYGYTTCFLAQVAEHVTAVDPHRGYGAMPGSFGAITKNIDALGLKNIEMIINVSQNVLPTLIAEGLHFDLVFVDGDHRYASAQYDLHHGWPLVSDAGALAVHDYGEVTCPEVIPAVDDWVAGIHDRQTAEVTDTLWTVHKWLG